MLAQVICAGFGGQGILTTGILIANGAFKSGKRITWYPSYGSEMRGGSANCIIKMTDDGSEIASPYAKEIDILLGMSTPAIDKFQSKIKPGGWLFVNSSIVEPAEYRDDINVVYVDAAALAAKAENPKGGNIAMIGAILKKTGIIDLDAFETSLVDYFTDHGKAKFNDANIRALRIGYDSVE